MPPSDPPSRVLQEIDGGRPVCSSQQVDIGDIAEKCHFRNLTVANDFSASMKGARQRYAGKVIKRLLPHIKACHVIGNKKESKPVAIDQLGRGAYSGGRTFGSI